MDVGCADLRISSENFTQLDNRIVNEVLKRLDEGSITRMPLFDMGERYFGFPIVTCQSLHDLDLLCSIISALGEIWKGGKLEIKRLTDLPRPRKVKIKIPGELELDQIMSVLKLTNPDLKIDKWSLVNNVEAKKGNTVVIFRIDEESLKLISQQDNKIGFTLRMIPVEILDGQQDVEKALAEETVVLSSDGGEDTYSLANWW